MRIIEIIATQTIQINPIYNFGTTLIMWLYLMIIIIIE